jgi:hypothetical protein
MTRTSRFLTLTLAALSAALLSRAEPDKPVQLGQVNFPTSCSIEARPAIETGVALLHSFQYQQADQTFTEASKLDSHCAMAWWGKAMAQYEQLWAYPSASAF